jgi:hypothetical protein
VPTAIIGDGLAVILLPEAWEARQLQMRSASVWSWSVIPLSVMGGMGVTVMGGMGVIGMGGMPQSVIGMGGMPQSVIALCEQQARLKREVLKIHVPRRAVTSQSKKCRMRWEWLESGCR